MKRIKSRQLMVAIKIIVLVLILGSTLLFYGGNTTSALDFFDFVHHGDEANNPSTGNNDNNVKPPAKVNYHNTDAETVAPVQVIPMPSPDSGPSSSTPPVTSPSPAPSPDTGAIDEGVIKPGRKPMPTPATITPSDDKGEEQEEMPANAGVLLQNLLDQSYRHEGEKVAYLTFDDGPTPKLTDGILDILKEENIKATFFAIGTSAETYPGLIKRAYKEGHGIGNHTYSHVFKQIYADPTNFIDELFQAEEVLQSILGEDKTFRLTRFPGGSFGETLKPFREAVNQAGFGYIDWNSLNGDAESVKAQPARDLIARLKETVKDQSGLIVLMHDAPGKETTVEALPEIIRYLRLKGYRFELLPGSR